MLLLFLFGLGGTGLGEKEGEIFKGEFIEVGGTLCGTQKRF